MPWYAWFSLKQSQMIGYARYLNKNGDVVDVTEVNTDPEYKHPYNDSIRLGRVTHYCGVQKRNHTKKLGRCDEIINKMIPKELEYERGKVLDPCLILN